MTEIDEVLKSIGIENFRPELTSDSEQENLRALCRSYILAETQIDRNDFKKKIKKLIHSYTNTE